MLYIENVLFLCLEFDNKAAHRSAGKHVISTVSTERDITEQPEAFLEREKNASDIPILSAFLEFSGLLKQNSVQK